MATEHTTANRRKANRGSQEYPVFLSFADPDMKLAEALHRVLLQIGVNSFCAPEAPSRGMPTQWPSGILDKGIGLSRCVVLLCTPNSLTRPWVLFELGAAAALRKDCFCACVQSVKDSEIDAIPDPFRAFHYRLNDKNRLKDLLGHIGTSALGQEDEKLQYDIDSLFASQHQTVRDLMSLASERWVFIAGNVPRKGTKTSATRKRHLRTFVRDMTAQLLRSGFSVTACPQVKPVGKVALDAAESFVAGRGAAVPFGTVSVDYDIGGLYPVDRYIRRKPFGSARTQSKWQEHLMTFRRSYLQKHEWLVLVGGTEGTTEEYEAVQTLNKDRRTQIRTYPIPCFGGSAREIFQTLRHLHSSYLKPCIECKGQSRPCSRIPAIVEHMGKA